MTKEELYTQMDLLFGKWHLEEWTIGEFHITTDQSVNQPHIKPLFDYFEPLRPASLEFILIPMTWCQRFFTRNRKWKVLGE